MQFGLPTDRHVLRRVDAGLGMDLVLVRWDKGSDTEYVVASHAQGCRLWSCGHYFQDRAAAGNYFDERTGE